VIKSIKKIIKKISFHRQLEIVKRLYQNINNIYPQELVLKSTDKCLVLSPHADDESIGCGGLILKKTGIFDVVCITDGRNGDLLRTIYEVIEERRVEFESAMQKANIDSYYFLDIEDGNLINNYDVFKTIEIKEYDYIFLPNFFDQHSDHKAVTSLLKKLLREKTYKPNMKIVFYEVWGTLALPNAFVDITDIIEEKRALINIYKSQIKFINYAEKIVSLNKYRGISVGKEYIEAFCVLDIKEFEEL